MKKPYTFTKNDTLCIKALAVMLMLIHHLFTFPEKFAEGVSFTSMYTFPDAVTIESIAGNFGKLCVALFMLLSGYGIYKSYMAKEQPVSGKTAAGMVIKRLKSVYIKYWQILIIFGLIGLIIGSEKISKRPVDWIKNLLAIDTTFYDEAWFLTLYVVVIVLFPLVARWFTRKHSNAISDIVWLIIFNAFAATVFSKFVGETGFMQDYNATYLHSKMQVALNMLPMFMGGCYLAKYNIIEEVRNRIPKAWVAKIFGAFLVVITFIVRQNWAMRVAWGWDRLDFIYAALFTIGFALILDGLKILNKGLAFIGKYSTGIWLTHAFFCYYYCQRLIYAPKNAILIFLLTLAIALLCAWAIDTAGKFIWKYIKPFAKQ